MGDRQRNPGSLQEKVWADSVTEKPKAELLHDRLEFPTFLLTFYTCYDKMFAKETGTARF